MLVAVASPLVAVLCVAALVAAVRRRMPRAGLPVCFAAMGLGMALVIRASVAGPEWALPPAGIAAAAAWATLAFTAVTIDSQLDPWWWRRFERDLDEWRSDPSSSNETAAA